MAAERSVSAAWLPADKCYWIDHVSRPDDSIWPGLCPCGLCFLFPNVTQTIKRLNVAPVRNAQRGLQEDHVIIFTTIIIIITGAAFSICRGFFLLSSRLLRCLKCTRKENGLHRVQLQPLWRKYFLKAQKSSAFLLLHQKKQTFVTKVFEYRLRIRQ